MRKYKVWGGITYKNGKQLRTIIATKTKKRALELLDLPYGHFSNYWCVTGNEKEIDLAMSQPETMFYIERA